MASGDINDALTNIPWVVLQDKVADPADPGANFSAVYVKNGVLMWLPGGGSATPALVNPMTTAADLIVGGASGTPTRLAKGAALQHLRVNAGATALEYADPPAAAAYFERIARTVVGAGGAASISFSSIPGTYYDLRLSLVARCDSATAQPILLELNDDTGANYDYQTDIQYASAHAPSKTQSATSMRVAAAPPTGATAGFVVGCTIDLLEYANTTWHKRVLSRGVDLESSTTITMECQYGGWRSTSAVTKITLKPASGNFVENSVFTLWGLG